MVALGRAALNHKVGGDAGKEEILMLFSELGVLLFWLLGGGGGGGGSVAV